MDKTISSGKIITTPVITEDGQPVEDPASNGTSSQEKVQSDDADFPVQNNVILDKEVIQWKLTLHQIGKTSTTMTSSMSVIVCVNGYLIKFVFI